MFLSISAELKELMHAFMANWKLSVVHTPLEKKTQNRAKNESPKKLILWMDYAHIHACNLTIAKIQ